MARVPSAHALVMKRLGVAGAGKRRGFHGACGCTWGRADWTQSPRGRGHVTGRQLVVDARRSGPIQAGGGAGGPDSVGGWGNEGKPGRTGR